MVDAGLALLALAGVLNLALAALLLALGFFRPDHRALALLLVLRGLGHLRGILVATAPDPAAAAVWEQVRAWTIVVQVPVLAYFAAIYPTPRPWMPRGPFASAPFLLAAAGLGGLWLFLRPTGVLGEPFLLLAGSMNVALVVVAWFFFRDYARAPGGPRHRSALLMSAAFTYVVLSELAEGTWVLVLDSSAFVQFPLTPVVLSYVVSWAAALAVVAATVAWYARRSTSPEVRRSARWYLAMMVVPLVVTGLDVALVPTDRLVASPSLSNALARLLLPAVLVYALLRNELFDLDLRLKRTLKGSTVAAAFLAAYLLATQGAQALLAPGLGLYLGVGAAALLAVSFPALLRAADRVAEAALPRVQASSAYLMARKLDVYRAALEQAQDRDGTLPPATLPRLAALREDLGLTERDHAVLAHAVRHGTSAGGPRPLPRPGEVLLGEYRVLRELGAGGFGRTYLCVDRPGTKVVVKLVETPSRRSTLLREAEALRRLDHPQVVRLREVREEWGDVVLVTEYVPGGSLADRLARGKLPRAQFAQVAEDLLRALEAVHAQGLVHRDVKPSNVLLTPEGRAKLADFGVAGGTEAESTRGGTVERTVGTVRFMSPEQARGRRATARSDLFSAAATLYEAFTGQPYLAPQPGESAVELQLRAASAGRFRSAEDLPRELRAWFATALHPDPHRRFASAAAMREAFAAFLPRLRGPPAQPGAKQSKERPTPTTSPGRRTRDPPGGKRDQLR